MLTALSAYSVHCTGSEAHTFGSREEAPTTCIDLFVWCCCSVHYVHLRRLAGQLNVSENTGKLPSTQLNSTHRQLNSLSTQLTVNSTHHQLYSLNSSSTQLTVNSTYPTQHTHTHPESMSTQLNPEPVTQLQVTQSVISEYH